MFSRSAFAVSFLAFCMAIPTMAGVTVEQIISREQREMEINGKHLSVGRDGHVFVMNNAYVLRFNREGTGKQGFRPSPFMWNVVSNSDGIIGVASGFMDSAVRLWSPQLAEITVMKGEFLDNEATGWMSPSDVQTGPSGDFYAPDTHRGRVLRFTATGKKVAEYSIKATGESFIHYMIRMRVSEPQKRFYIVQPAGNLHAIDFDGKKLWTINAGISGSGQGLGWKDYLGDYDCDDEGNVYILKSDSDTVEVYDKDGKPSGKIKLEMGDLKGQGITLRVSGDDIFVKRAHRTEMFQVYDRNTGKLRRVVQAEVEFVRARYDSDIWTAGQPMPFAVTIEAPGKKSTPNWPVQIAMFNDSQWKTLPVVDGKVTPPADAAGLYQIRVGYGEYTINAVVEIRKPGSRGTVNILTPHNRVYFGRGEDIPVTVIVRGGDAGTGAKIALSLKDGQTGAEVLHIAGQDIKWNAAVATTSISKTTTAKLRPGRYILDSTVDGMTVAPQVLVIGPGLRERPIFNIIQGGDGAHPLTSGGLFESADEVAAQTVRSQRIGINMFIDRLGDMVDAVTPPQGVDVLTARLKKDPLGVAPEKAQADNLSRQVIAARGAFGIEEQAVLMHMDSMIPMLKDGESGPAGWLAYYGVTNSQKIVKTVSSALLPYTAFRGWTWAMNWWFDRDFAFKYAKLGKADEFQAIRKKILDSGKWDTKMEKFGAVTAELIPEADRTLNYALQQVAPGKLNAVTGPYRQSGIVPPVSMATAAEVDLFLQAEQIQMPFSTGHNVDFYKRPGKRAFGHPEPWNELGLGDNIMAIAMPQAIRGADGTGWEGALPTLAHNRQGGLSGGTPGTSEDIRSTWQGQVSVFRSMSGLLKHYGPWLTTLENSDRVAIVVSTRMLYLDYWEAYLGGIYFQRLYEAYNACMYAHRPASFVFVEDLKPDTLKKYKALLVVGQRVELEPAMATALADAQKAGVSVFYDGTCREEHVKGFTPLNISFDAAEKGPNLMNVDLDYYTLPKSLKLEAEALTKAIGQVVAPVAEVQNPEIMLTERRNGEGRFVWALNNDLPNLEPYQMWRLGSYVNHRVPQVAPIKLDAKDQTVYEIFAMQQTKADTVADLQSLPVRLFAILPKPIESVTLTAGDAVNAGNDLTWSVAVSGPKMSYPVRLRLIDADGTVLEETFPVKTTGAMTVPMNAGASLTLEATELISGKKAQRQIKVAGGVAARPAGAPRYSPETLPIEKTFGPHLRDLVVSQDGSAALINAMNWTDNYYVVDTANGAVRRQSSLGHQFAYGPQASASGFYLQGYDVTTPEGYHLYDLGTDGKPAQRIANYGLSQRYTLWIGSMLVDRINNFVVAPNGKWIANAGNLGLVVWGKDGESMKRLWSLDWWKTTRQEMFLMSQGSDTLITMTGMTVAAHDALTGHKLWDLKLGDIGAVQGGVVSADGHTIAVRSDSWGGRVYVIRDGKLVNTFFALPDNVCLTPDGKHLLMNVRSDLRSYAVDGGIEWVFSADDWLHHVRLSPDGKKIAVGSDLGTLYVLDLQGHTLLERDFGASPIARWLDGGDLLVATWMGDVIRLGADGTQKWKVHLETKGPSRLQTTPAADTLATVHMTWGDASDKPASLDNNLLTQVKAVVSLTDDRGPANVILPKMDELTDGKPQPPAKPWMDWVTVGSAEIGWCSKHVILVESPQTLMSVDSITFVEDPAHPESWLRNMVMQVWAPAEKNWVDCQPLLSNSATHTHTFEKPFVGYKFRFLGDKIQADYPGYERAGVGGIGWPVGSIRLGEVVFHGKALGPIQSTTQPGK